MWELWQCVFAFRSFAFGLPPFAPHPSSTLWNSREAKKNAQISFLEDERGRQIERWEKRRKGRTREGMETKFRVKVHGE